LAALVTERIAYISGYEDGAIRPDGSATRAEFAAIISGFDENGNASHGAFYR
jgi:hypothetical protein